VRLIDVSPAEHAALVRHATVLCFPSLYEGFGLPPLEALRVGTPVVATAVGALPELISDRVPLISPGDTVALTEALVAAVEDPSVDAAVVDRIAGLTWDRAAAEMTDVYRRVVADAG
jgi:glycosyltransferase involved in cell wall biosynthesis